MSKPAQLREQAREIRRLAKYASGNTYYKEIKQAKKLEAQANAIERKNKLVAKVKIAQKQLQLDDDTYRDLLERVTGKRSAAKLTLIELDIVLEEMKSKGFKATRSNRAGTRPQSDDAQSRLIRSLWIQLHEAGKVRDPSEKALVNFAKGQFKTTEGIEALQWLDSWQKSRLIESLKKWLDR